MIKLEVGTYCQDCMNFVPEALLPKETKYYAGGVVCETQRVGDIIVCCKNSSLCKHIRNHIHKEMLKEKVCALN